jgi:hypothetical protein
MPAQSADVGSSRWRCALQNLFVLKEGPWRWSTGIRAAFANTLPMATFALAGHLSLGLIASLGAFTALYGMTMPLRVRLRVLPLVAAGFVVASVLGVLCPANASLTIACLIVVALLASMLPVESISSGVCFEVTASDHYPIWFELKLTAG